ncbi:MAG: RIP metalloprotease RseP [Alphaproteobacteria bacterium]|nr:RIP metalloprotease RseP [Alphaproteobacteria bacterium]
MLQLILHNLISFICIISLIVFIHEFGHFWVARLCGVQVDEFAIGFGRELFGFTDKKGTRWKICPIPFGGYVKMYGDKNGASMPDSAALANMSPEERRKSFLGKNVWQRMGIVGAGPLANFILTIFLFTALFRVNGLNTTLPIIDEILPNSAAAASGLQKADEILRVNNDEIESFEELRMIISQSADRELQLDIMRGGRQIDISITPKSQITKDIFGEEIKVGMLGITSSSISHRDLNIAESFVEGNRETYRISIAIFKAIWELITGRRSVEELGGPIKIAKYSGKTVDMGISAICWFMAMISLNLGIMNILPIPALDGGHLFYYLIEAIRGKALSAKYQNIGFQIGLSLILALMVVTTFNDIMGLVK